MALSCSQDARDAPIAQDAPPGEHASMGVVEGGPTTEEVEGSGSSDGDTAGAVEGPAGEPGTAVVLPPPVEVRTGSRDASIGASGGELAVHGLTLRVPEQALSDVVEFSLEQHDAVDSLQRSWPGGLPLAVARVTPWNPGFSRAVYVTFPLSRAVEPGTSLEVLAWQPSMRSFIVAGRGRVDESGQAVSVSLRQLGDLVVRAEPVRRAIEETACERTPMRLHERWPGGTEASVVGLVEVADRLQRDIAFNVLSDARLLSWYRDVDFKNEEVNDSPATRRNELAHRDEDFLFDPNAAAALELLAGLVRDEWVCPLSGQSAYQVRVTEGYDSLIEHSQRSTHYQGRAVDLTLAPVPAANGDERREFYGRLSSLAVCAGFDYVLFENLAHAHASVVPTRYALLVRDEQGLSIVEGRIGAAPDARRRVRGAPELDEVQLAWTGETPRLAPRRGAVEMNDTDPLRFVSSASTGTAVSPDLLKQIVVLDGRAWLSHTVPLPPAGSAPEEPSTVDIAYPWPMDADGLEVLDATFRVHERTAEARERLRRR